MARNRKTKVYAWIFMNKELKDKWIKNNCDMCYSISCVIRKEIENGNDKKNEVISIPLDMAMDIGYNPFADNWECSKKITEVL